MLVPPGIIATEVLVFGVLSLGLQYAGHIAAAATTIFIFVLVFWMLHMKLHYMYMHVSALPHARG